MTREEAKAVLRKIRNHKSWQWVSPQDADVIISALEQPEIICCRECKYQDEGGECNHKLGLIVANDDSFCSYAERREE